MKKYFLLAISFIWIQKSTGQTFSSAYLDSAYFYVFTNSALYLLKPNQGIIKTDYMLNPIWEKHIPILDSAQIQIRVNETAWYILKGTTIYKVDSAGNNMWAKEISTNVCPWSGSINSFGLFDVDETRIYLTSIHYSPPDNYFQSQIVLDTMGNIINSFCDSTGYTPFLSLEASIPSFHGGVWIAKKIEYSFLYGASVVKIEPSGQIAPNAIFDGACDWTNVKGLCALPDSNYLLLTETGCNPGHQMVDCVKFNDFGNIIWAKSLDSPSQIGSLRIATAISAAGGAAGSVSVLFEYVDSNYSKRVISTFDASGNIIRSVKANNFPGNSNRSLPIFFHNIFFQKIFDGAHSGTIVADSILNSACYSPDTLVNISTFNAAATMPNASLFKLTNCITIDTNFLQSSDFIFQLTQHPLCSTVSINEPSDNFPVTIYPNPNSSSFTIRRNEASEASLEIFNTLGEKVYATTLSQDKEIINAKLKPGIYFVNVNDGRKQLIKKLVVE